MAKTFSVNDILALSEDLELAIDYESGSDPIYVGLAEPGTKESAATGWKIFKLTYDAAGNVLRKRWANGTARMDKAWASRASYNYAP